MIVYIKVQEVQHKDNCNRTYRDEHVPWQQGSDSEPVEDDVDHPELVFRTTGARLHLFHHPDVREIYCEDKISRGLSGHLHKICKANIRILEIVL